MNRRLFGAHWLALAGGLQQGQGAVLKAAAVRAVQAGCRVFELACKPVNGMGAGETAQALLSGGIHETSFCRFFPSGDEPPCGDPLGDGASFHKAVQTIADDIAFIETLRTCGLIVNHMTGPNVFVLGKKYNLPTAEVQNRICGFLRHVAPFFTENDLQQNVEYLRPGEDEGVIGSMQAMCDIVDAVNLPHVRIHADTFHMLERGEVPHEALLLGGSRIGYLHAHGSKRVVPGAYKLDGYADATDAVNWHLVGKALLEIGYAGPVVPEPFGAEIRQQIPELGNGLPPAIDAKRYYEMARAHLEREGILTY